MSKGKIYCAHNIFTGKKYIGQTVKKHLSSRANEHIADCVKYTHKFANALKKYGRDAFIWGIVEECDVTILNDREIYWIETFDTLTSGYNTAAGGHTGDHSSKEYCVHTPDGEVTIHNLTKYCRDHDLNVGHLHQTLSGKRKSHKGYWLVPRTDEEIAVWKAERNRREDTSCRSLKGERNGRAKLNAQMVNEIRVLHASRTHRNREIADQYGIALSTLEKVVCGDRWA
jgi:group I intron endonuclease